MRFDYLNYKSQFDANVLRDMKKIDEKINEEKKNETPDQDAIMKLRIAKLYRGMELCSGYANRYRMTTPY